MDERDLWPLTGQLDGAEPTGDEDLTLGFNLLAALAASDETMVELSPGVWKVRRAPGDESAR